MSIGIAIAGIEKDINTPPKRHKITHIPDIAGGQTARKCVVGNPVEVERIWDLRRDVGFKGNKTTSSAAGVDSSVANRTPTLQCSSKTCAVARSGTP